MKKQGIIVCIVTLIALFPALSRAQTFSINEQFAIVGSRAMGMGGAGVAAVNDATAVHWNPAALADYRKVDIRIPAAVAVQDHMGLTDNWDRINEIYSLANSGDTAAINEMISLLNELNQPDTGTDINASGGLLISIPFSKSAMAISALGSGSAGFYPTVDTLHMSPTVADPNFVGHNNSAVTGIGMAKVEPAVSFATSFANKVFIGVNAKMIYAETYVTSQTITSNDFSNFLDDLKNTKTSSSTASVDAGILIAPWESFRIGVVGRNLNSPTFPIEGVYAFRPGSPAPVSTGFFSGDIELEPQYRAGIAWRPFKTFTLAADYDVSKNKTFTPGYESQVVAVGLEKTFLKEILNFRLGAHDNTADKEAKTVYTAGFGFRIFAFRVDVAAGYDFDERQGEVAADLALKF